MSLWSVLVFPVKRPKLKREPSRQYLIYTSSSKSWTACESTQVKQGWSCSRSQTKVLCLRKDLTCHFFVKQFYHLQELPEQPQSHTYKHTYTRGYIIVQRFADYEILSPTSSWVSNGNPVLKRYENWSITFEDIDPLELNVDIAEKRTVSELYFLLYSLCC